MPLLLEDGITLFVELQVDCTSIDLLKSTAEVEGWFRYALENERNNESDEYFPFRNDESLFPLASTVEISQDFVNVDHPEKFIDIKDGKTIRDGKFAIKQIGFEATLPVFSCYDSFPFDDCMVVIKVQTENKIEIKELVDMKSKAGSGTYFSLMGTSNLEYKARKCTMKVEKKSILVMSMVVRRHVGYYIYNFVLPMMFILTVGLSIYGAEFSDFSSRATINVTLILSTIALKLSLSSSLPKVQVFTVLERYFILSLLLQTWAMLGIVLVFRASIRENNQLASSIDLLFLGIYGFGLVFSNVYMIQRAYFFNKGNIQGPNIKEDIPASLKDGKEDEQQQSEEDFAHLVVLIDNFSKNYCAVSGIGVHAKTDYDFYEEEKKKRKGEKL